MHNEHPNIQDEHNKQSDSSYWCCAKPGQEQDQPKQHSVHRRDKSDLVRVASQLYGAPPGIISTWGLAELGCLRHNTTKQKVAVMKVYMTQRQSITSTKNQREDTPPAAAVAQCDAPRLSNNAHTTSIRSDSCKHHQVVCSAHQHGMAPLWAIEAAGSTRPARLTCRAHPNRLHTTR